MAPLNLSALRMNELCTFTVILLPYNGPGGEAALAGYQAGNRPAIDKDSTMILTSSHTITPDDIKLIEDEWRK